MLLIAVFCGVSATMLWNDYTDKQHDARKGKMHAQYHSQRYSTLARWLWCICASCVVWADGQNKYWLSLGIFTLCLAGLFYDLTYRVTGLSMVVVGVASASVTLFALLLDQPRQPLFGFVLFVSVTLTLWAREILKDLDDTVVDRGYKRTLPAVWGRKTATLACGIMLLASTLIAAVFRNELPFLAITLSSLVAGVSVLMLRKPERIGKTIIDVGMAIALFTLLTSSVGS